ncbi:GntR family transcriptional regulator [Arsenicicoccus cauae]|uniref:GntR family transcriptional regulator n=1 Tax=Arsenicicoccus cauae TaxID=2663847 RepID=UPI00370CFE56
MRVQTATLTHLRSALRFLRISAVASVILAGQGHFSRSGLTHPDEISGLARLRSDADGVIALFTNHITHPTSRLLDHVDFTTTPLFNHLEKIAGVVIDRGTRTITAVAASPWLAQRFGLAPHAPLLYLEQVTYEAAGRPVECSDIWVNPRRMHITADVIRARR